MINGSSLGMAWVTWLFSTSLSSSCWDQWTSLGMCFSKCWQTSPVIQVLLPLDHLTFANIPLAKVLHMAKNVKHQRNIVHLFSEKCKVTWQMVCTRGEVKKIGPLIQSTTGEELKQLLWYQDCHINVQVYPAQQHLVKGVVVAAIQTTLHPSKAMHSHMGLCHFSNKSTVCIIWSPVWNSPLKAAKNAMYHSPPTGCNYKLSHQVFQFLALSTSRTLFYTKSTPTRYHFKHMHMYDSQYTQPGCQGI